MATRPTKKQKELLSFIENFVAGHGYGPSYREIMQGLGYKSVSTVAIHVENLIARGHLRKRSGSARSLEVVKEVETADKPPSGPEQWLVSQVEAKFSTFQRSAEPQKLKAELETLIKALQILGLSQQAQAFASRLESKQASDETSD